MLKHSFDLVQGGQIRVDLSALHAWHSINRAETECAINVSGMVYHVKATPESIDTLKDQESNRKEDSENAQSSTRPEQPKQSVQSNVRGVQLRKNK